MLEHPEPLSTRLNRPVEVQALSAERDAEAFAEHVRCGGEPLRAYLPWPDRTRTPAGARAWLATYEQREDGRLLAAGAWSAGELIGGGVLFEHDVEVPAVELGVWVVGDAVGAGVATAICRLLLGKSREELGVHRVAWACATENERSVRLAERLGFRHEGTLREAWVLRDERRDGHIFGLIGEEIDAAVARGAPAHLA